MNSLIESKDFSFGNITRVRENGKDFVNIAGKISFELKGSYEKSFDEIFTELADGEDFEDGGNEEVVWNISLAPISKFGLDKPLLSPKEPFEGEDIVEDMDWMSLPNSEKEFRLKLELDEMWVKRQEFFKNR